MTPPAKDEAIDVLVVGAGVSGLATALALLNDGRAVTVIDAGRIGGGASHGNCGTLTPSHAPPLAAPGTIAKAMRWMLKKDAPLFVPPRFDPALWRWMVGFAMRCNERDWEASARAKYTMLADSRLRIQQWIEDHGLDCDFVESGEDYVFRDGRAMQREMHEIPLLRDLGIDVELIDGSAYEAQEPAVKPGVAGAIRFSGDAALRPDKYVAELARIVRERGGIILEHCALHALDSGRDGVVASTAQGTLRARDVVIATGAWSPRIADAIGLPWLRQAIQPGKGYSMTYSAPALVPKRPLILHEPSVCVSSWPGGFRLGSTMEFSGYDQSLNATRLAALERGAREYLHEPVGATVHERWYGWRPMTWDDLPILGRAPRHRHVWLATGHGMLGVSMSAASGQLMADLITGKTTAIDPSPYRMERFA